MSRFRPSRVPAGPLSVLALLLATVAAPAPAAAQMPDAPPPVENSEIFDPLELPTPTDERLASGEPGPDYWQNAADYEIDVRLHPKERRIEGSETITYTNRSPDDLERLWIQLDQNLFEPDSRGARTTGAGDRFRGAFEEGGYEISGVRITRDGETAEPEYLVDDTRMRIELDEPLAARGGTLELSLDFAFTIPEYGADRMGWLEVEEGTVFELAQWYPRMYVYDDVHGWNPLPYLGLGEFYLEYGSFDVEITVPRDFLVVATGTLENPSRVLTGEQRRRLEEARNSAETVTIVGRDEVGTDGIRPEGEGPLTWRFRADSVRDFAWAASGAFIWDAASASEPDGTSTLVMSAYPEEGLGGQGQTGWEKSTQFARHSIEFYSEFLAPYPYPVAINVAGVVGGMEYPMIVFCSVNARGRGLFGVTDHELGHEWFPMIVGSDERRWFWMDEGLNSFLGYYSARDYYGESFHGRTGTGRIARMMASPIHDQPSMTRADRLRMYNFGFLSYRKPAAGLVMLREFVLGPELFDPAFEAYFQRWKYRHPKPADFFRTIEDVAGEELDWFWRGWFLTTDVLDQAVGEVTTSADTTRIVLENRKGLVMPLELEIGYADGSSERRRVPVEAWFTSDRHTVRTVGRDVARVVIDPDRHLPDVERENNRWTASSGGTGGEGDGSGSAEAGGR